MTTTNESAPAEQDRGGQKGYALGTHRNPTTDLPRGWRCHLVAPKAYFLTSLFNVGKPDARGIVAASCPLHVDAGRSLRVRIDGRRGSWHCHHCRTGGDMISFHMRRSGLSFPQAVEDLMGLGLSMGRAPGVIIRRFALCAAVAELAPPLSPAELVMFEQSKVARRLHDERVGAARRPG